MSNYIQHMNNHIEKYPTTALLKFFITLKKKPNGINKCKVSA